MYILRKPRQSYLFFLNCVLRKQKEDKRKQKEVEKICALNIESFFLKNKFVVQRGFLERQNLFRRF